MKSPPFAYARAGTAEEAVELLSQAGEDAKLLAGGQSLVPLLAYRLLRPSHLVDVDGASGLDGVSEDGSELTVGALVRHAQLERTQLRGAHALLRLAARHIGHLPIRTRGTLGGSLAHADPAAELPVAATALEARIVARSTGGEREIPAEDFFLGPFTTALEPGEMVVALRVPPAPDGARAAFREFAVRSGDFALASVAAAVVHSDDGVVGWARIALGAVEAVPLRLRKLEQDLTGTALEDDAIATAAEAAAASCDPIVDRNVDAATRRDLVAALVRRALRDVRAEVPA